MRRGSIRHNQKIKSFLFFLLLATSIWFLTKFSKSLVGEFNLDLVYHRLPEQVILSAHAPKQIQIKVKASGFRLISEFFKPKTLSIDLSAGRKIDNNSIKFTQDQLLAFCYRKMPEAGMISMELKELLVPLDRLSAKIVDVKFQGNISLAQGFRIIGTPSITPSNVTIYGPLKAIDTIKFIKTSYVDLIELRSGRARSLALKPLNLENTSLSQDSIQWSANIIEHTQKQIELPVKVINVPKGIKLQIFPETMLLTIEIPVDNFGQYDQSNFNLICDYNERISEDSFMIPTLKNKSDSVFRPILSHKKVDYVEFTK